jgi:hypothetical protein
MEQTHDDSFLKTLLQDIGAALSRNEIANNQASRRDTIRTAFAVIEGLVWIFREEIAATAEQTYGLDDDENTVLQERQLSVSEQGKISAQARYLPLTTTIRFVARIASRITGAEHFDFGGADWDNFRKALSIRHRITHPKSANDLHVSNGDVEQVTSALFWFLEMHAKVLGQTVETHKRYLGQLDEVLEKLKEGNPEMTALYNTLREDDGP